MISFRSFSLHYSHHFFSGIGRGTAFVRQGSLGSPLIFLPKTVPTAVNGKIINKQIAVTLN